jgi:antitoxin MazE
MRGDAIMNGVVKLKDGKQKVNRYSRKVGRMGNSLGISLPKILAEKLNVVQGDEIEFIENEQGEIVLKKLRQMKLPENVRPEVLEAFFDVFEEDEGIFKDLRDR